MDVNVGLDKMKKNILILVTTKDFLEKFELNNVRILTELGYRVHYAANTTEDMYVFDENRIREMGVEIHHIDIARSPYMVHYNRKAFLQLVEIVKKYDIDAIHCHTPVGGLLGRLLGNYFKEKPLYVVYTAHGFHFYKGAPLINNTIFYMVEKKLANYTDYILTINQEDYENVKKFNLRKNGKYYYIPSVGLNMEWFYPFTEEEVITKREKIQIDKDDFFIVSTGELNLNKNHQVVLQALEKLKKSGKDISRIKFGICGEGLLRKKLQDQIIKAGLEDKVSFYGFTTNVSEIVGCADVFVFPSIREGLGMAALEALSMKIPVIASDNRGTREYMEVGKNGYIYKSNDSDGFAHGIEKIQYMATDEKTAMKNHCRDSVCRFEKSNTEKIMYELYQELSERIEKASTN